MKKLTLFTFIILSYYSYAQQINHDVLLKHTDQHFEACRTNQIGVADLDKDGDLDAVFSNMALNYSQVLLNDGNGNYTDSGQKLTQCGHGVGIGDLDNDGDLDLMITCAGWTVNNIEHSFPTKIYFNDGNAKFTDSNQHLNDTKLSGNSIDLFDIDNDNDLDAFIRYYENPDKIYLNDGKGNFSESKIIIPENAVWGDLNSDNYPDILVREASKGIITMLNNKNGGFEEYSVFEDTTFTRVFISLADLDNDSDLDAIVTNGTRQQNYPTKILLNDKSGKFQALNQKLSSLAISRSGVGDINMDGYLDIVFTNFRKPSEIWLGNKQLEFKQSEFKLVKNGAFHKPVISDLDNDGDNDIFIPHFFGGSNELWFNQLKTK